MYSTDPKDGMQGNEDLGQMSAWYILCALGFYPVDPVSGIDIVGSPLFDHATLELGGGRKLVIEVRRKDPARQYVQAFSLKGKPQLKTWFRHGDIAQGGKLVLEMGSEPNPTLGSDVTAAP
jgi:putative alpha-1,2-mannosidase